MPDQGDTGDTWTQLFWQSVIAAYAGNTSTP